MDFDESLQRVTRESDPVTRWFAPVTHSRTRRPNRLTDLLLASLAVRASTGRHHHRGER